MLFNAQIFVMAGVAESTVLNDVWSSPDGGGTCAYHHKQRGCAFTSCAGMSLSQRAGVKSYRMHHGRPDTVLERWHSMVPCTCVAAKLHTPPHLPRPRGSSTMCGCLRTEVRGSPHPCCAYADGDLTRNVFNQAPGHNCPTPRGIPEAISSSLPLVRRCGCSEAVCPPPMTCGDRQMAVRRTTHCAGSWTHTTRTMHPHTGWNQAWGRHLSVV